MVLADFYVLPCFSPFISHITTLLKRKRPLKMYFIDYPWPTKPCSKEKHFPAKLSPAAMLSFPLLLGRVCRGPTEYQTREPSHLQDPERGGGPCECLSWDCFSPPTARWVSCSKYLTWCLHCVLLRTGTYQLMFMKGEGDADQKTRTPTNPIKQP